MSQTMTSRRACTIANDNNSKKHDKIHIYLYENVCFIVEAIMLYVYKYPLL